jgi:hypothetical protein
VLGLPPPFSPPLLWFAPSSPPSRSRFSGGVDHLWRILVGPLVVQTVYLTFPDLYSPDLVT